MSGVSFIEESNPVVPVVVTLTFKSGAQHKIALPYKDAVELLAAKLAGHHHRMFANNKVLYVVDLSDVIMVEVPSRDIKHLIKDVSDFGS